MLGTFRWPIIGTLVVLVGVALFRGPGLAINVAAIILIEAALSLDNAVINGQTLAKMTEFWRRMFLTVGLIFAVVGIRFVLPILLVSAFSFRSPLSVAVMAFKSPNQYAEALHNAFPGIVAFGGAFLLNAFLGYFADREQPTWLIVEKFLRWPWYVRLIAVLAIIGLGAARYSLPFVLSGIAGSTIYYCFEFLEHSGDSKLVGAGWLAFVYLNLLDAALSLDGVLGAFAVSHDLIDITLGLGLGAWYVRVFTVWLIDLGVIQLRYLAAGAHWSICVLAFTMFAGLVFAVPDWMTASASAVFVIASLAHSVYYRRKHPELV